MIRKLREFSKTCKGIVVLRSCLFLYIITLLILPKIILIRIHFCLPVVYLLRIAAFKFVSPLCVVVQHSLIVVLSQHASIAKCKWSVEQKDQDGLQMLVESIDWVLVILNSNDKRQEEDVGYGQKRREWCHYILKVVRVGCNQLICPFSFKQKRCHDQWSIEIQVRQREENHPSKVQFMIVEQVLSLSN